MSKYIDADKLRAEIEIIILNHRYNGDEYSFHNLTNIETYDQLRTL